MGASMSRLEVAAVLAIVLGLAVPEAVVGIAVAQSRPDRLNLLALAVAYLFTLGIVLPAVTQVVRDSRRARPK